MMTRDIEVIKAFKVPIEQEELEILKKTHTYISDKLILDAVNGINVVARDFHEVSKSRQSISNRVWDGIIGASRKRQDLINENVMEGINACTSWLRDHDRHISRIDNSICTIANELDRTQDEILKFYSQHKKLKVNVDELKETFFEFKNSSNQRINHLENWMRDVDIRDRAYNQLSREISKLKAKGYAHFNRELQIYTVLDNLKSGEVGLYYHNSKIKEKLEIEEYIKNELKNSLKDQGEEFVDFQQMIGETHKLKNIDRDALSLISTQHYNSMVDLEQYPEISDLVSIVSSYPNTESKQEIEDQSNIRTFITYNDFIEDATREHLII